VTAARLPRVQLIIEYGFAAAVFAAIIYSLWFLSQFGYLPQPFFYDYGDTWMDWFNPAYWSHQPGAYDAYMTIYPPLSYAILKFITWGPCYVNAEGGWSRDCDVYGAISLHLIWVACVVLTGLTLRKVDRRTWLPRSFALGFGLPMLWGLDRGNLVMLAYICVLLAYGPLLRSARLRWLFAGMAINLKIYLIGTVFTQLLYRRWRWFEGTLVATLSVYLVSYMIFGSGSPAEIYHNILDYSNGLVIDNPLDLWMASSLHPLMALLDSAQFPSTLYVGSRIAEFGSTALPIITLAAQGTILAAAAAVWWRPNIAPRHRLIALSIGIALMTTEVSGYTETLVILFVFMERFEGIGRRVAILLSYLVCIPADISIDRLPPMVKESFLGGRPVVAEYMVQLGPFIRPMLFIAIPVALALVSLRAFAADLRTDGWRPSWRFRNDARLLARPGAPISPV